MAAKDGRASKPDSASGRLQVETEQSGNVPTFDAIIRRLLPTSKRVIQLLMTYFMKMAEIRDFFDLYLFERSIGELAGSRPPTPTPLT